MVRIEADAVGLFTHTYALRDSNGSCLIPCQVALAEGTTATFEIVGRVSPDAPWAVIRASASVDFLEALSLVNYLALKVTSLSDGGSLTLWIGER